MLPRRNSGGKEFVVVELDFVSLMISARAANICSNQSGNSCNGDRYNCMCNMPCLSCCQNLGTTCSSNQVYANGGCVASATACPAGYKTLLSNSNMYWFSTMYYGVFYGNNIQSPVTGMTFCLGLKSCHPRPFRISLCLVSDTNCAAASTSDCSVCMTCNAPYVICPMNNLCVQPRLCSVSSFI